MENLKNKVIRYRVNNTKYNYKQNDFYAECRPDVLFASMDTYNLNKENEEEVYLFLINTNSLYVEDKTGIKLPFSLEDHEYPNCTIYLGTTFNKEKLEWFYFIHVKFNFKTLEELYARIEKMDEKITHIIA